jgi:hypothetical protein
MNFNPQNAKLFTGLAYILAPSGGEYWNALDTHAALKDAELQQTGWYTFCMSAKWAESVVWHPHRLNIQFL